MGQPLSAKAFRSRPRPPSVAPRAAALAMLGLGSLLGLAACSGGTTTSGADAVNQLAVPDKGNLLGASVDQTGLVGAQPGAAGVNAYLWRAAIDVLSFMPFMSADPVGGVIITDWYTPPTVTGERFKATAYVLGRDLNANDIRVAVFRQDEQGGSWVDTPVASNTATDITARVLQRARQLRAGATG